MDVLARCVEPPVQGDLRQLWSKSKPRHGGNTLDSFVVDLGSALEDALVLLSTSEQTEKQEESLESRVDDDNNNNDQSPLDSDYSSSWTFHGSSKKLISAMKGSRKKRGRKVVGRLRVSWAPDVYDPPVTSQSHSAGSSSSSSSHNQHSSSRHKKTSKNKANKANSRKSKR